MDLVESIAVIATLGATFVWITLRVRQSSVVAYLALGVVSGPSVFALLGAGKAADDLAAIGLVLLLFFVGLEFDVKSILKFARFAGPATLLQVGFTTAALAAAGLMLGYSPGQAVLIGLATALSSTAIVMKSF